MSEASVRIQLLGGLSVEVDGVTVPAEAWSRRYGAALVGLLALADKRRLHREQVMDALWRDLSVSEASPRLHKAAHHARRALGTADALVLRSDRVALFPEREVRVDAVDFADAAGTALKDGSAEAADAALVHYGGELLPDALYEPWTEEHRERLRVLHLQMLRQAKRWDALVELDPTDESAHVELMRALHERGDHRAALLQYDLLAEALERELGTTPGRAATELRDAVAEAAAASVERLPGAGSVVRLGEFPQPSGTFLGRASDLEALRAAMDRSRVVTLFGPGGVGKTRLAVEYARDLATDCTFVDLSRHSDPAAVATATLVALGASARAGVSDLDRVVEVLAHRPMVLILDSCEHLVDAAAEMAERLATDTEAIRVLATSREALDLAAETIVKVAPLSLPRVGAAAAELRDADAVRLFCERAEQAGGDLDAEDLRAVAELVRRLDGIPLALELAAARSRTFSAAQMLEQLEAGGSVRAPRRVRGPAHHVSLEDTIDWSYRLLEHDERSLLLRLSTFQGPFDLSAVIAVAEAVPMLAADVLARLVDKSLVQSRTGRAGRRLRLLDSVRRFASARVDAAEAQVARDRHAAHFADRVATLGKDVPGSDEDDVLAQLATEYDDVVAAFEHASAQGDVETVARLVDGPRLSVSAEGARWAHLALRAVDMPGLERDPRYVSILASAAWGAVLRGDLERARALARRGIDVVGDPTRHARLCWIWPQAVGDSFSAGVQACVDGAQMAHKDDDIAAESFLLSTAALYRLVIDDVSGAVEAAERALELARTARSRSLHARAAGALAYALQDVDADAARRAASEVLEVAAPGDFHLNMPHRVMANLAWREGDAAAAAEHAVRAGDLIRDQGDRYVQATAMRQLAVTVGDVDARLAAELLGVADSIVPGIPVIARDVEAVARLQERLLRELGADEVEALLEEGRRADAREAYAAALRGFEAMRAVAGRDGTVG